jgi:hypothetical protein
MVARDAIQEDLSRSFFNHPGGQSHPADDISRWHKPQKNYFWGHGVMECPVCGDGKLRYERQEYNGHIRARCSTDGCVAWIE